MLTVNRMNDQQQHRSASLPNRLPTLFPIGDAIQLDQAEWIIEDFRRRHEIHAVLAPIRFVFRGIPIKLHVAAITLLRDSAQSYKPA